MSNEKDDSFRVTLETSGPNPRNISAHLLKKARCTGVESTEREQKGRQMPFQDNWAEKSTAEKSTKRNRAKEWESSRGGRKGDDVEAEHLTD